MRKIEENEFASFTIAGDGWSMTIHSLKKALYQWNGMDTTGKLTFYGNKRNGYRAILDTK